MEAAPGLTPVVRTMARGAARGVVSAADARSLRRRLVRAMRAAGVGAAEVALSLVDDVEVRALNRTFRAKDRPTDVLSFGVAGGVAGADDGQGGALGSSGAPRLLGDIVISVETAARQARAARRPLLDELLHLAVHGLVHLLGYDHATVAEERVMFGWEELLRAESVSRGRVSSVPPPIAPDRDPRWPRPRRA